MRKRAKKQMSVNLIMFHAVFINIFSGTNAFGTFPGKNQGGNNDSDQNSYCQIMKNNCDFGNQKCYKYITFGHFGYFTKKSPTKRSNSNHHHYSYQSRHWNLLNNRSGD